MKKYYEDVYEGFYENAHLGRELAETLAAMEESLQGIYVVLGKLLAFVEGQELEAKDRKQEEKLAVPAFKIGADLCGEKVKEDLIAKAFGNA